MFFGRDNGLLGVGLGGQGYEGDVGYLVDGLATNLSNQFASAYGYQEIRGSDF